MVYHSTNNVPLHYMQAAVLIYLEGGAEDIFLTLSFTV